MRQRRVLEYSQFKVHGPGRGLWSQSLTIQRPSCRGMSSPALGGCPETPGSRRQAAHASLRPHLTSARRPISTDWRSHDAATQALAASAGRGRRAEGQAPGTCWVTCGSRVAPEAGLGAQLGLSVSPPPTRPACRVPGEGTFALHSEAPPVQQSPSLSLSRLQTGTLVCFVSRPLIHPQLQHRLYLSTKGT